MRGWVFAGVLTGLALRWGFDLVTGGSPVAFWFGAALLSLASCFLILLILP